MWYLPISMHKAMNSIPNTGQKREKEQKPKHKNICFP